MKKQVTLSLASTNANAKLTRGQLDIPKGKQMVGLRLKFTVPVANTSGGTLNPLLTDAQRQTLLGLFTCTLSYGKAGAHKPFSAITLDKVGWEARRAYGSEIEGYADTSTGMAQSAANSTTPNVVFYAVIPTGRMWWLNRRGFWGMGRSQTKTVELELKRGSTNTIASGIAISGTVTVDVSPDLQSCKGDRWCWVPEYVEQDESDKTVRMPDGLPLAIMERTAAHASSTLSNISVYIGDEEVHDQVTPAELLTEVSDSATMPSAALLTDRETLLYTPYPEGFRLEDLPTGAPRIVQNVKDLTTFKAALLYIPVKTQTEVQTEIENIASNLRRKTVHCVSLADVEGGARIPDTLRPFIGFTILDEDDADFERFPGYTCTPGGKAEIRVPNAVLQRAVALHAQLKAANNGKAAEEVIRQVSNAVPGAVASSAGYAKGNSSDVHARVRGFFQ